MTRLGINIDHIATVRQARGEKFPDPVEAAKAAVKAGADGITAHLREDRRHIQDDDIRRLKTDCPAPLNLEMAAVDDIIAIAEQVKPAWACLVPEKRAEKTTEGGLLLKQESAKIAAAVKRLKAAGIRVSLFIEPDLETVESARDTGADAVEFHTGVYARLFRDREVALQGETARLVSAAKKAAELKLLANAGHGLDYDNVGPLLKAHRFHEFNIGFAIVSRAFFVGMTQAVKEMKEKIR